jgi:membrane protein required for colicin V production
MIWADFVIIAVIALSALVGFFRGFLRETLGLATWIAAFYCAFTFANAGAVFLRRWVSIGSARLAIAFFIIFIIVLLIGAIFNHLLGRLINGTGFAGSDRVLGIVFGVVRGVAVLVLLVLLAGVTPVPRDSWWQRSLLIGHLEAGALWVRGYLPSDLAGAITYPDAPDAPSASSTSST